MKNRNKVKQYKILLQQRRKTKKINLLSPKLNLRSPLTRMPRFSNLVFPNHNLEQYLLNNKILTQLLNRLLAINSKFSKNPLRILRMFCLTTCQIKCYSPRNHFLEKYSCNRLNWHQLLCSLHRCPKLHLPHKVGTFRITK